jgi:hypothetical protein
VYRPGQVWTSAVRWIVDRIVAKRDVTNCRSWRHGRTHVARLRKSNPLQPIVNRHVVPTVPPATGVPAGAPLAVLPTNPAPRAAEVAPYDPLANLRDRLTRRPGFEYDGRPPDEKKLI